MEKGVVKTKNHELIRKISSFSNGRLDVGVQTEVVHHPLQQDLRGESEPQPGPTAPSADSHPVASSALAATHAAATSEAGRSVSQATF